MGGRVVLMCGRSFSGKTTVATNLADALGGRLVSLDTINEERGLYGEPGEPIENIPIAEWSHTMDLAHERVVEAAAEGALVVIDDSSSPRFLRDNWRELASSLAASLVLVYVHASREAILERQSKNREGGQRRDVSDRLMTEHLASFEPPTDDENALLVESGLTPGSDVVRAVRQALMMGSELT